MLEIGIVLIVVGELLAFIYIVFKKNCFKSIESKSKDIDPKKKKPLKVVKLYNEDGTLLQNYEGVYLSHFDTNIYHLYTEEGGRLIIRLDIGANMLLTSENVNVGN